MTLYEFLTQRTDEEVRALADLCETTPLYIWKHARAMRRGKFTMKPKLAALLEAATNQTVHRWECSPDDWFVIWPELVGTPGAPNPVKRVAHSENVAANDSCVLERAA